MKKTLRKITIILIICLLVLPLVPLKHTEAAVVTETTESGLMSVRREKTVKKGETEYAFDIQVLGADLNSQMGGFVFLVQYDEGWLTEDISLETETEGWKITCEKNFLSDTGTVSVRAICEVIGTDIGEHNYLIDRNAPQNVKIKCRIPVNEENNDTNLANIKCVLEQKTDYDGNVTDYYEKIEGAVYLIQKIDSVDQNQTTVEYYSITTKLNGNNETDTNAYWSDFFNTISGLDEAVNYKITDFKDTTIVKWENEEDDTKTASTSKLIVEYANGLIEEYNIYVLGDIKLDTDYAININDVNHLRRAIVGDIEPWSGGKDDDFCIEASDLNNSNQNGEDRGIGDIGDVILLRKRIVNCVWD